jgi:hypothetical protein
MEIFLDDLCIFSCLKDHEKKLQLCFDHCNQYGISLMGSMPMFSIIYHCINFPMVFQKKEKED